MPSLRAHHVGITVRNLEELLPFYRDVLDLDVIDRFSVSGEAFSTAVDIDDARGEFVHLAADGVRIELVEYEPEARETSAAGLNQPGATHIALAVDDVASVVAGLPDDVETISEPQTTASGSSIVFLRDPEQNLIEVIET